MTHSIVLEIPENIYLPLMAEAEAKTIQIQAQAIQVQGGAAYVQMKAIEKWDGKLPQVSGGGTPFIQLPAAAGNTK